MNKRLPVVSVIMGSDSDLPVMRSTIDVLNKFTIRYEVKVLSAHRSPKEVSKFAEGARMRGVKVIIAGAGGAAHLAGVIASLTTLPVIGVPMETKALKGIDSLLAILQMPSGVPVATMSIGSSGAKNAGILACEILSISDKTLKVKLDTHKKELVKSVKNKSRRLKV